MRGFVVVLLAAAVVFAAGCAGEKEEPPPSQVTGVITKVEGEGSRVTAITVEDDGESYKLFIAAEADYGFDLNHLREHRATGDPVRCRVEERDGRLYALSIEDA